ncbi:PilW family protein [Stigmatella aurantiaca]|uniref:Prepilin-type N-terminal cleavage/methylation domain protein n=1 Tax=Stigmatella aurantiaca (strain DW4/3-1) TaxID=378806 RepID=Q09BE3_STIAD|nr:prepilin-type N-terminal cleavage/methylation domain-containing protein [Stigmatella aurantiaca]ADO69054.1 Prepilin-type N-terminal cleavage/methylation domain protein [Stigmatella aurantiaca DW4/3-1]EAU69085.1 prepilin-type N-terminal cleavage/methylation domain protein [Stigmatella aurantiaca DW4/3-1]
MRPSRRGFTLIELLVGGAVGSVVLLGISLTFISQARQYQTHASRRAIQSNARQAMSFMSRHIRSAGYGVDPDRTVLAYDSFNASDPNSPSQPGFPDAVVVHSRDLLFRRDVDSASSNRLVVTAPIPLLQRGQILLVLCRNNGNITTTQHHAFVTVSQKVENSTEILLDTTDPTAAPNAPTAMPGRLFHEQALLDGNGCYDKAQIVKINRAAFYVAAFDEPGSPNVRTPYLMMHQGLDLDEDGTIGPSDAVPVAEGIEQLQVAYILNSLGTTIPRVLGVNESTTADHYGEQWQTMIPPQMVGPDRRIPQWYTLVLNDLEKPAREEDSPVNIRQLRITVVSRSSNPDPQHQGDNLMLAHEGEAIGTTVPWRQLENLSVTGVAANAGDFTPQGGGFYRVILRESITPKNIQLNSQFIATTQDGG